MIAKPTHYTNVPSSCTDLFFSSDINLAKIMELNSHLSKNVTTKSL